MMMMMMMMMITDEGTSRVSKCFVLVSSIFPFGFFGRLGQFDDGLLDYFCWRSCADI